MLFDFCDFLDLDNSFRYSVIKSKKDEKNNEN